MSEQCKGRVDAGYWWGFGLIDPSEPDHVAGKGVWISQTGPCGYVANSATGLCPRHEALAKEAGALAMSDEEMKNFWPQLFQDIRDGVPFGKGASGA